jgi:hypothetical protein
MQLPAPRRHAARRSRRVTAGLSAATFVAIGGALAATHHSAAASSGATNIAGNTVPPAAQTYQPNGGDDGSGDDVAPNTGYVQTDPNAQYGYNSSAQPGYGNGGSYSQGPVTQSGGS